MAVSEHYSSEELHPIDIVETLAEEQDWEFDRLAEDQICMVVEGQWKTYSITLAWSDFDETLKMVCTFEMEPPTERMPALYELLNEVNDQCWAGAYTFWAEQKLMVYRYGLVLAGGSVATPDQITTLIKVAVMTAERFYPAFQLTAWGDQSPQEALQVAIAEAYGRA
jgi:hypothetical protein